METVTVRDKRFRLSIPAADIQQAVKKVAERISQDYEGREPLFLAVLNGSFMFAADLMRHVSVPAEIAFVRLASYQGTQSAGHVKELIGLNMPVEGRHIVVVEDIVDTGFTMQHMLRTLRAANPASVEICTLLLKPTKLQVELDVKYPALTIPDDFVVGYGLDYDGFGRNLADIYTIAE